MDDVEQELALRRLRRARLAIRLLVYGGLTVALVPVHFRTTLDAPCAGQPWQTPWWEREGRGVPFRF